MFKEAIQSVRTGQRRRARDLLTRLLKTEPENVDYWVWLSAAVETEKEQIYCLQKALALDPNSIHARRGLVMLGAITPDQANLPAAPTLDELAPNFPARQAATQVRRAWASTRVRSVAGLAVGVLALGVLGYWVGSRVLPRLFPASVSIAVTPTPAPTSTATPSETPSPTETSSLPGLAPTCAPPATISPAVSLAEQLCLPAITATSAVPTEQASPPEEAYQAMRAGYRDRNWDRVLQNAEQSIELYPDSPYPYFYLAEAQRNSGNTRSLTEAERNYSLALERNRGFAPAYVGRALARLALRTGRPRALEDLQQAIESTPPYLPAYTARAELYLTLGETALAIADLEAARVLAPRDPGVVAMLSLAYSLAGQTQNAFVTADEVLLDNPANVIALYARGRSQVDAQDYEGAVDSLRLALPYLLDTGTFDGLFPVSAAQDQRDRVQAEALLAMGSAQARSGEREAALVSLDQALSLRSDLTAAQVERGELRLQATQYDLAREDFNAAIGALNRAVVDNPLLIRAYIGNGQALLASDLPQGAVSNFQAALRGGPDNVTALIGLGQAGLASADYRTALSAFDRALPLAVQDADQIAILLGRAATYRAQNQFSAEANDLAALARRNPGAVAMATIEVRLTEIQLSSTSTPTRSATPRPTNTVPPTATLPPSVTPVPPSATPRNTRPPAVTASANPTGTPLPAATATRSP
jgi:tetratricopeptide (TPR) repeat protein